MPLAPSGVGHATRDMIVGCLNTGKFSFTCLGGAIKHDNYQPVKVDPFGDDWIIYPIDGFGNQDLVRSFIRQVRPDVLWIMSDPRFYSSWFWLIEHEIRRFVPIVYYHVWDNFPTPLFNKPYYISNDLIACISKVTHKIVQEVAASVESIYVPHAVDPTVFHPISQKDIDGIKNNIFGEQSKKLNDKIIFFWNSRNARRKMSGTLIWWFNDFLEKVGKDKACLIMHTDVKDPNGTDLEAIVKRLKLTNGEILFSTEKYSPEVLAAMYNISDCTVSISNAEGWGLSLTESLSCGTPLIATMTGGMQEQIFDGENWFGVGIEPVSKPIIGSLEVPYIYEDYISQQQFVEACEKIYNMTPSERKKMGEMGREHILKNCNFAAYQAKWVEIFEHVVEKYGSWGERKNYCNYRFEVLR